jgi:ribosome-associated protein
MDDTVKIDEELSIPLGELEFRASRASGPGGQHVNKVSSRVTLRFDVAASPTLSDPQKIRIAGMLRTRMTRRGVLQLHCQSSRSQTANRRELIERFADLLRDALRKLPTRRKTAPSRAVRRNRLKDKRRRGEVKQTRRSVDRDSD